MSDKKTIIITGGWGRHWHCMGTRMAKDGYSIVLTYLNDEEKDKAQQQLEAIQEDTSCDGMAIQADVTRYEDSEKMVEKVKKGFGRIDVLVNNAVCSAGGRVPPNGYGADAQHTGY